MCKLFISGFLLIFVINFNTVLSQTTGGGAPTAPSPLDLPQFTIMPGEDLNQFENTRLNRTKTEYRHGQSTLTPKIIRKSNAEVNAELEKRRAERLEALEKENAVDYQTTDGQKPGTQDSAGSVNDTTDFSAGGTSALFRWTDKDGIVHVTDNLGSVPPEYRDQTYNSK